MSTFEYFDLSTLKFIIFVHIFSHKEPFLLRKCNEVLSKKLRQYITFLKNVLAIPLHYLKMYCITVLAIQVLH